MDGIGANGLLQASAFFKSYNGKRVKGFFTTFLPVICAKVLLEHALNFVTFDYMLLRMVYIVCEVSVSRVGVFNFLNLLYDNIFLVSFINKLFSKFSRMTVVVFEC